MIKQNQKYLNRLNMAADFLLVFFAYLFSAWFRLKVRKRKGCRRIERQAII